jgi:NTP pyrophosphatase (non-canonical NTP hydrolase)
MVVMRLNDYQQAAMRTAVYPEKGTGSIGAVVYTALGLGEVGEVQGKIKKALRDDGGRLGNERRIQIADELGDSLWYLACLAGEVGFTLQEVAQMNLEKLADRQERGVLQGSGDQR